MGQGLLIRFRKPSADVTASSGGRVIGACLLASAFALQPLPALAAEFVAADDSTVSGEIIRLTKSTVTIRPVGGSMIMLAPDTIKRVRYTLNDGETIEGALHDWYDGTYVLEVRETLVGAKDGALLPEASLARPDERQEEDVDAGDNLASTSTPPDETPPTAPSVDPGPGSGGPVETGTSTAAVDRANQNDPVEIEATADVTSEEAGELVFDISSSRPWKDDIIVLFATLDGTAKAGTDFESKNGVVRLPAGATSIQLAIPLIDDDEAEDDELLTLFLSSAIDVATIPERKIVATIRDDD